MFLSKKIYKKKKIEMPEKDLNGSLEAVNHTSEPLKLSIVQSRQISNPIVSKFEQHTAKDSPSQRNKLVERAVHWCLVNGFAMVPKHIKSSDLMCVTYFAADTVQTR